MHELYIATGRAHHADELSQRCINGRRLLTSSATAAAASAAPGRGALVSSNSSSSCSTSALDTVSIRRSTDVLRASANSLVRGSTDTQPPLAAPHPMPPRTPMSVMAAQPERAEEATSSPGTLLSVIEQSAHLVAAAGTAPQPFRPSISMPSPGAPAANPDLAAQEAGLLPRPSSVPFTGAAPAASMRPLLRRASVCAASVPEFVLQVEEQRRGSLASMPALNGGAPAPSGEQSSESSPSPSPSESNKRKASLEVSPPNKRSSEPTLLRQVLSMPSLHAAHAARASVAIANPSHYKRLPPVLGGNSDAQYRSLFSLSNARRVSESEPIDFLSWQPSPSPSPPVPPAVATPPNQDPPRTSFS